MAMIGIAVHNLDSLETIVAAVQIGAYNRAHYDTAGAARLWALGQGAGVMSDVEAAWALPYTILETTKKDAAAA